MIKNYLKIAIKVLFRRRLYTFITLTGISITLMIVMLATSFWQHMLADTKPQSRFKNVTSLITLKELKYDDKGEVIGQNISPPTSYFIDKYLKTMKTPVKVSAITALPVFYDFYNDNVKEELSIRHTDYEFFEICDFNFLEGRPFNATEFKNKQMLVVVDKLTADLVSPNESAIGKKIDIYAESYKIVGVIENIDATKIKIASNIYLPLSSNPMFEKKENLGMPPCAALILANSPGEFSKIDTELQTVLPKIEILKTDAERVEYSGTIKGGVFNTFALIFNISEQKVKNISNSIVTLITIFFLILPATNLVNINVSRIYERSSEIGVRKSFGAHSGSIATQFIIENIFITLIAKYNFTNPM